MRSVPIHTVHCVDFARMTTQASETIQLGCISTPLAIERLLEQNIDHFHAVCLARRLTVRAQIAMVLCSIQHVIGQWRRLLEGHRRQRNRRWRRWSSSERVRQGMERRERSGVLCARPLRVERDFVREEWPHVQLFVECHGRIKLVDAAKSIQVDHQALSTERRMESEPQLSVQLTILHQATMDERPKQ